jgi:hypothetical protein
MRDVEAQAAWTLPIKGDLQGDRLAAVVYGPVVAGYPRIRLNRTLLSGDRLDRVLSWARRELARGARVSWLLADELDDLA